MNYQAKRNIVAGGATFAILGALSFSHLFNDMLQSLVSAVYPLIKESLHLGYGQIGLITLTFQFSSSVFQPIVGWYTDSNPKPLSLPIGMGFTMCGLLLLSIASQLWMVLCSVALIGFGSAIFHPEASRLAHMASGGKHGLAQSLFQVGGNLGSSMGPLLAALIVAPYGRQNIAWFSVIALTAIIVMIPISRWYKANLKRMKRKKQGPRVWQSPVPRNKVIMSLFILLILIFSKYVYTASLTSYYTFYLMHKFHISVQSSQFYLFIFLFAVAAGTLIGGPVGDRIGRKYVIWVSILGVAPFTILMPYANLAWTCILSIFIGLILSSAFSAILVYAQELLPGKVGTIAGLFFGLAFGIAGIASAVLGKIADHTGIEYIYHICSFLPLLGLIAYFLPDLKKK